MLSLHYVSRYYIGFKKNEETKPSNQTTECTRIITDFLSYLGHGGRSSILKRSW